MFIHAVIFPPGGKGGTKQLVIVYPDIGIQFSSKKLGPVKAQPFIAQIPPPEIELPEKTDEEHAPPWLQLAPPNTCSREQPLQITSAYK